MNKEFIATEFKKIQESICTAVEKTDGKGKFLSDVWRREQGGGGDTRIMLNGDVLEKAGVLFSEVHGPVSDSMKNAFRIESNNFYATGVSIVMHPINPFVPIIHMNIRYFETGDVWWFGGGIDLTPIYINAEDAKYFHSQLKQTCDKSDLDFYPKFKKWADDYFYLPHRKETRGIGGIFFDRLNQETGKNKEELLQYVLNVGNTFIPTYSEIIQRNRYTAFSEEHLRWQGIRRSRYVEYNLLYDKGTKFGLESDGRVESILMSMPPIAEWKYNYQPQPGQEQETIDLLVKNKAWI